MKSPLDEVRVYDFPEICDPGRGNLTVIEEGASGWPFPVKRVFCIYDVPDASSRGGHAHKTNCELLICISGSFNLHLTDGSRSMKVHLNRPDRGIIIPPDVWTDMHDFAKGTILLVLCSEPYSKIGYIHDFEEYKNWINANYD